MAARKKIAKRAYRRKAPLPPAKRKYTRRQVVDASGVVKPSTTATGAAFLTAKETSMLVTLAERLRVKESGKRQTPLERALLLEIGDTDVITIGSRSTSAFASSLSWARKAGTLGTREFNYTVAPFSPGVGLVAENVLWIKRTA